MERSKKIVITAHCVLNQNSVVYPCARKMKDFSEKISGFLEKNIGIVQVNLSCQKYLLITFHIKIVDNSAS